MKIARFINRYRRRESKKERARNEGEKYRNEITNERDFRHFRYARLQSKMTTEIRCTKFRNRASCAGIVHGHRDDSFDLINVEIARSTFAKLADIKKFGHSVLCLDIISRFSLIFIYYYIYYIYLILFYFIYRSHEFSSLSNFV